MDLNLLLTKGYFPEELLPPFTTEDLAIVKDEIVTSLAIFDPINRRDKVTTKMMSFSIPKIKGYRRTLGIPHPLLFARLAHTITTNWVAIESYCNRSPISLSKIKTRPGAQRAVLKPSFNDITREKVIRSTGNRFLLKIDIAKFYNSIYTHSIPWALHTKAASKVERRRSILFGNGLDEDARRMQDGQTIGLPIGPDTSRIISEIILTAIDKEIEADLGYLNGVRVVDDYHLYFRSTGELEKGRAIVHRVLKGYELELNQSKEHLLELPEIIESEWFSEIREFNFRNKWNYQRIDLITYFDTVISYTRKFPEDIVMTYAMSKLRFTVFNLKNWKILQSLMMNALLIEPKILPYVAQNLVSYHQKAYPINIPVITEALVQFIEYHLSLLNDFEVAWALWIAKALKLTLPAALGRTLSNNYNPIVVLISLDLHQEALLPGVDKTGWERLLTANELYTEHWLIAYEGYRLGWLNNAIDHVSTDPFFKLLKDNNVAFYKPDRTLDISKVRVTSMPEGYFEPEDDDHDNNESESVFASVTPPTIDEVLTAFIPPEIPSLPDDDDLPF
ncbi:MAG: RNA-directed DNA polymerase [Bacteroidota bacterium]